MFTTERQTRASEEGLITERITKAVRGLGEEKTEKRYLEEDGVLVKDDSGKNVFTEQTSPNIEVRTGAIFSLERIAQDSPRDHLQIMDILVNYIREHTRLSNGRRSQQSSKSTAVAVLTMRSDIQAALTVIGRRRSEQRAIEASSKPPYRIRLQFCDLSSSDLSQGNFDNGLFDASNFSNCILVKSSFRRASFSGAKLDELVYEFADFSEANFAPANYKLLLAKSYLTDDEWSQVDSANPGATSLT